MLQQGYHNQSTYRPWRNKGPKPDFNPLFFPKAVYDIIMFFFFSRQQEQQKDEINDSNLLIKIHLVVNCKIEESAVDSKKIVVSAV